MKITEVPSVHGTTGCFAGFIRDFIPKAFIPKVIRNLYATPLLLFVPLVPL